MDVLVMRQQAKVTPSICTLPMKHNPYLHGNASLGAFQGFQVIQGSSKSFP